MIVACFALSVLIEGFWLTRPRFLEQIGRRKRGVRRAVLFGNFFGYLIVGPLFYPNVDSLVRTPVCAIV